MLFEEVIPDFTKICSLTELKEGIGKRFEVNGIDIAVFRVEQEVFAINNVCTHLHKSILCDGFLEDGFVICPAHGWEFNLKDGKRPKNRRGVDSYLTEIRNGDVFVKVFEKRVNY